MRAGSLRHRAEILSMGADLAPASHGSRWVGIRAKESADAPAAAGLRTRAMVEVRARSDAALIPGRYLLQGGRLLHITSVRDPMGNGAELVLSCEELVGEAAQYKSASGVTASPCRVFLQHGVARVGDVGRTEYTTQLEAALIEVGRPQPGALFVVAGQTWRVAGLVDDEDDRVVRRMWVKPL